MSEGTVEMSRISLRLRVGEQGGTLTHDAPLRDPSSTLAVFLEGTLRDLEVCLRFSLTRSVTASRAQCCVSGVLARISNNTLE